MRLMAKLPQLQFGGSALLVLFFVR